MKKPILKGIAASPGKVSGKVKIVNSIEDSPRFKNGDILVTKITNPTMVQMMAKASAIVCDIGSITSHPSIVSREMGIPCIVGTKKATKILKDNMKVKINGQKGEIYAG